VRDQLVAYYSGEPLSNSVLLNLENPAAVAYELMTLSFVLDWFIPIGTYLHDVGDATKIKFEQAVISHKYDQITRFKIPDPLVAGVSIPGAFGFPDGTKSHTSISEFERRVYASSEISPHIMSTLPKFKPLFKVDSYVHALAGIALLTSYGLK
jgi:hypothetical protein